MTFQVAGHQTENYTVSTPVFTGPLDLLLQLIERAELDITRLALAQVTDQYLAHMRGLAETDAAEVSAFLVIAAKLIQIKSEALLPRPVERAAGEEDPGEALANQLRLYRIFKTVAAALSVREAAHLRTFLRLVSPNRAAKAALKPGPPPAGVPLDLGGLTLSDLLFAAQAIFNKAPNGPLLSEVVSIPKMTIRARIREILQTLRAGGRSSYETLLSRRHTRVDAVVTFLAILELVKRRVVEAEQTSLFADITINTVADWNPDEEFELSFGE